MPSTNIYIYGLLEPQAVPSPKHTPAPTPEGAADPSSLAEMVENEM